MAGTNIYLTDKAQEIAHRMKQSGRGLLSSICEKAILEWAGNYENKEEIKEALKTSEREKKEIEKREAFLLKKLNEKVEQEKKEQEKKEKEEKKEQEREEQEKEKQLSKTIKWIKERFVISDKEANKEANAYLKSDKEGSFNDYFTKRGYKLIGEK